MTAMPKSPREELRELTEERILDALLQLGVGEGGFIDPSVITYARIAELAGVSERTVYRFFPSKEAFEQAMMAKERVAGGVPLPQTADALGAYVEQATRALGEKVPGPVSSAGFGAPENIAGWNEVKRERLTHVQDLVGSELPDDLDEDSKRAVGAVIRTLVSMRTVIATAGDWGMSIEEAGRAHAWAIEVLVRAIQEGDNLPWPTTRAPSSRS